MEMNHRPRRLRRTPIIRDLVSQPELRINSLIQPYFVTDSSATREEIKGMPGVYREAVDSLITSVSGDVKLGVNKVMLFGVSDRKDTLATSSMDAENPVIQATQKLKDKFGDDLFVVADAFFCDHHPTLRRPAGNVQCFDERFLHGGVRFCFPEPQN